MPAETINIRYELETEGSVVLTQEIQNKGYLSSGYIHFPPGCQGTVYVRVSVMQQGDYIAVCPIDDHETNTQQWLALDAFTIPFPIDMHVAKKDRIRVELENHDDLQDHTITVVAYRWDEKPMIMEDAGTLISEMRRLAGVGG